MNKQNAVEWGDIWTTTMLLRTDSDRLKKLALPRKNKKPYERRLEHKYEVITRALDLLERDRAEEKRVAKGESRKTDPAENKLGVSDGQVSKR